MPGTAQYSQAFDRKADFAIRFQFNSSWLASIEVCKINLKRGSLEPLQKLPFCVRDHDGNRWSDIINYAYNLTRPTRNATRTRFISIRRPGQSINPFASNTFYLDNSPSGSPNNTQRAKCKIHPAFFVLQFPALAYHLPTPVCWRLPGQPPPFYIWAPVDFARQVLGRLLLESPP